MIYEYTKCIQTRINHRTLTFNTLYTVDATKFVTAQIDATFQTENVKLTINSVLQELMLGCLGRAFVGKQSKDTFRFCHNA